MHILTFENKTVKKDQTSLKNSNDHAFLDANSLDINVAGTVPQV